RARRAGSSPRSCAWRSRRRADAPLEWHRLRHRCLTAARPEAGGVQTMAEFPSEEWLKLYVERINESKEYKEAAATWEGDIGYVFEAEPDKGVNDEVWAWLDLWHGDCRD